MIVGNEVCEGTSKGCASCKNVVYGWECDDSIPSVCKPKCGDGYSVTGEVDCDDGDLTDNKGCLSDCSGPISGWNCTGKVGDRTKCEEICDDGLIVGDEVCDDNNTLTIRGCNKCKTID